MTSTVGQEDSVDSDQTDVGIQEKVTLTWDRLEALLVLSILGEVEGQGYGGMSAFECARETLQEAVSRTNASLTAPEPQPQLEP